MTGNSIGVFGATGHTGAFVATDLKRRGQKARLIGRDEPGLAALQAKLGTGSVHVATVDDHAALLCAFDGLDAVINCAGPFFDTSRPVIAAALESGCHYLDVTAEQPTVLDTIARYDEPARVAGLVVMPAMAFYGGLADLLTTALIDEWNIVDTIDIAVALDSWHPTAGTRITGERNTAPRMIVRGGEMVPIPAPTPTMDWSFPEPFGHLPVACVALSEIILLNRHIQADAITSYMTLKPLQDLADASTPPPQASDDLGRSSQRFALAVRAAKGDEVREAVVSGQDIYAVSAPLVVEAACRLVASAKTTSAGVLTPGELFDAKHFLASLDDVLTITRNT